MGSRLEMIRILEEEFDHHKEKKEENVTDTMVSQ